MSSLRISRVTSLALVLSTTVVGLVEASEPWLALEATPACAPDRAELAAGIERRIAGTRNRDVQVHVVLEKDGANLTASIRTRTQNVPGATRRIVASSCEEALGAVISVASLALSSVPGDAGEVSERHEPAVESKPVVGTSPVHATLSPDAIPYDGGLEVERGALPRVERAVSLFAQAGLDAGTLDNPTPLVGLGVALPLANAEVRVVARYGLRSSTEEVATTLHRASSDFATLSVAYCRGLDSQRWFGLCGGLAGRVTRSSTLQTANGRSVEENRENASLGLLGGALFVHRGLSWEPQLDLSVEMSAMAGAKRTDSLSVQALLGAALPL